MTKLLLMDSPCRSARINAAFRDVRYYGSSRADDACFADRDGVNDRCPSAYHAIVTDGHGAADGHSRCHVNVVADAAVVLHCAVRVDDASPADLGAAVHHCPVEN